MAYLREHGWPTAERRALAGNADKGDVINGPACVEVKNCQRVELGPWLKEADVEAANAGEDYGVVWVKLKGVSDPGRWAVVMRGEDYVRLVGGLYSVGPVTVRERVRRESVGEIARATIQRYGGCGEISPDGKRNCIMHAGHPGPHQSIPGSLTNSS